MILRYILSHLISKIVIAAATDATTAAADAAAAVDAAAVFAFSDGDVAFTFDAADVVIIAAAAISYPRSSSHYL